MPKSERVSKLLNHKSGCYLNVKGLIDLVVGPIAKVEFLHPVEDVTFFFFQICQHSNAVHFFFPLSCRFVLG